MTIVSIDNPPPLNNLFRNTSRGRAKTRRYMTWIQATLWKLKEQGGAPVSGPIKIHMWIGESETQIEILPTEKTRPKGMRADIDGLLKAPFDILKTAGLIDDDRMVQDTHVQWRP